jgi:hypothetical protein
MSVPFWRRWVAKECRRVWQPGLTPLAVAGQVERGEETWCSRARIWMYSVTGGVILAWWAVIRPATGVGCGRGCRSGGSHGLGGGR